MTVRRAGPGDRDELVRVRTTLWTDSTAEEVDALLGRPAEQGVMLVAERAEGGLCGFAEVGTRPYAEGCSSSPVAYLEGIWVDPDARRAGVALALMHAAEGWARSRGLSELASDTTLDNPGSEAFHRAAGFEEAERIICYRRSLE